VIYLNLDIGDLLSLKDLEDVAATESKKALQDLVIQTEAHIIEEVQAKLHSSREKYLEALHVEQVDADTWSIILDPDAMWIEEGMDEHEMIDDLLKSKSTKTAADGSKYLAVPFEHKKGPTQQTQAQRDLTSTIKQEMKDRGIPWGGLESDAAGQPKQGLIHSFDILTAPLKDGSGPGQGHGPIGAPRQGPTGVPFLAGVRVYQKPYKDKNGEEKMRRSVVTFRTASSKMKGSGRWVHPGLEAKKFLDEAAVWALKQWEEKIKDKFIVSVTKSL
jgi:hypothetical protein